MSFIIKISKTIRNNWKKSLFGVIVLSYGTNWTKNYLETQSLMRVYCQKAVEYGKKPSPVQENPRNLIIILNPNANNRKATDDYDKYCAPLLHLAGICVDVIKTESEGHAKQLVDNITEETNSVVVAGGDGTLSEVLTGLLRKTNENTNNLVPIGVLPLGRSNSLASALFPGEEKLKKVRTLVQATMAIVEENTRCIDVMRVEAVSEENAKPVYAVNDIKWGAYRDADALKDNYWYFGRLRNYATYLFGGLKSNLTYCEGNLQYTPPCEGCSNCYLAKNHHKSTGWFGRFAPVDKEELKYLQINNPKCTKIEELDISTSDFLLHTQNKENLSGKLTIHFGPKAFNYTEFVKEGFKTVNGSERKIERKIEARTVNLNPKTESNEQFYSIDNENFEVKPIRITLLPKLVKIFCTKEKITI